MGTGLDDVQVRAGFNKIQVGACLDAVQMGAHLDEIQVRAGFDKVEVTACLNKV